MSFARERRRCAFGVDPISEQKRRRLYAAHAIQHQPGAAVEMQREPVPAFLIGAERLARPFAIHPGAAGDLRFAAMEGNEPSAVKNGWL